LATRANPTCPEEKQEWISATAYPPSVGNTPLVKPKKALELTGRTILGKAEFLNPGGPVKRSCRALHDSGCRGERDLAARRCDC